MRTFLLFCMMIVSVSAFAVEPDEMLKDPALETRARDISRHLRCLVCQGEAIDESNAQLAKDLRLLVRARINAGDTDEQVLQFLQQRYGDFILLKPPLENKTLLLWLMPVLVLGTGLVIAGRMIRKHKG